MLKREMNIAGRCRTVAGYGAGKSTSGRRAHIELIASENYTSRALCRRRVLQLTTNMLKGIGQTLLRRL